MKRWQDVWVATMPSEDNLAGPHALQLDRATGRLSLTLAGDAEACEYDVVLETCADPLCTCTHGVLSLSPVAAPGAEAQRVFVDFALRQLSKEKDGTLELGADPALSVRVVETLSALDWNLLAQLFLVSKQEMTESADPEDLDTDFPVDAIEYESSMVGYTDILPFGARLDFAMPDRSFVVFDHYCVVRKCDCKEVMVSFSLHGSAPDGGPREPLMGAWLNYQDRKWRIADDNRPPIPPKEAASIIEAFEENFPDWPQRLAQRHTRLRELYAIYLRKHGLIESAPREHPVPKVGRNDPCPCGSGRKFKKCCLGKV